MDRLQQVRDFFQPNEEGVSEWKTREEIMETPLGRNWGNGAFRYGVLFGVDYYLYEERRQNNNSRGRIDAVRTSGIRENHVESRPIRPDIRSQLLGQYSACIVCGCSSSLVIDHKNHLYNNPRVLHSDTQVIDDFQVLCNHCNTQKRQTSVDERRTGIRYPGTRIPQLAGFGIDYIHGDASFDTNDPNTMNGTYWYDPLQFMVVIQIPPP